MVADEMIEKAIDKAVASLIDEHPMGHWRGDQVKEVARRAIAALSAAGPVSSRNDEAGYVEFLNQDVPYIVRDIQGAVAILTDLETRNVIGYRVYDPDSAFARQTAPSVAVKALHWKGPDSCGEYHSIDGLWGYIIRAGNGNGFWLTEIGDYFPSPEAAQAAAQADYEARIRSALSAQVQDVAGWQSMDTAPKDGTPVILWTVWVGDEISPDPFSEVQIGYWDHGNDLPESHEFSRRPEWVVQRIGDPTHWMPLPAPPSS